MVQVGDKIKGGFWDGFEVISVYSRAQAIEDGELVDVTELAQRRSFRYPVAVTASVWAWLERAGTRVQFLGRSVGPEIIAMELLLRLYQTIKALQGDTDRFDVRVSLAGQELAVWALVGPGDDAEPVITVMLEGGD